MLLDEFDSDDKIFVDSNVFIFNALDDVKFGKPSTDFLSKIENEKVNAAISTTVMDEIFFKILIAESSKHMEKMNVWELKRKMKEPDFVSKIYEPVRKYSDYLFGLSLINLEIVNISFSIVRASVEYGRTYGLLTSDAIHVACCKFYNIENIATNDSDFERVDFLKVWKP